MSYKIVLAYAREMRKNPTPAERVVWEKVRDRRFMGKKINRQYIIEYEKDSGKRRFYIADFHCYEHQLIIEIDGGIHRKQLDYDKIREDRLAGLGYEVIRFSNEMVLENWEEVAERLAAKLSASPTSHLGRKGRDKRKTGCLKEAARLYV